MNKDIKNIDDLFKSTLGEHKVKAPAHIKSGLFGSSSKLFILLTAGAIVSLAVIAGVWFSNSNTPVSSQYSDREILTEFHIPNGEQSINTYDKVTRASQINSNEIDDSNQNARLVSDNINTENQSTAINNNSITSGQKEQSNLVKQNQPKSIVGQNKKINLTNKIKKTGQSSNSTISPALAQNTVNSQNKSDINTKQNTDKNTPAVSPSNHTNKDTTPNEKANIGSENGDINIPQQIDSNSDPLKEISHTAINNTSSDLNKVTQNNSIVEQDKVPTFETNSIDSIQNNDTIVKKITDSTITDQQQIAASNPNESLKITEDSTTEINPIVDIKQPKKGYWMFNLEGGPKINYANYKTSNQESLGNFLAKTSTEKLGYFAQFNTSYTLKNNLSGGLGIGLEKQSFKTTYFTTFETIDIDSIGSSSHYIFQDTTYFDSTGNPYLDSFIVDTSYITEYDTTKTPGVNNQNNTTVARYLQIPINIGYQFQRNKWIFGFNAGVQINYLLNKTGTYYINNEIIDLSTSANNIFKKTVLQYNLSTNFSYNVLQNVYLSGRITYAPKIQNYYNSSYSYRGLNAFQFGFGASLKF